MRGKLIGAVEAATLPFTLEYAGLVRFIRYLMSASSCSETCKVYLSLISQACRSFVEYHFASSRTSVPIEKLNVRKLLCFLCQFIAQNKRRRWRTYVGLGTALGVEFEDLKPSDFTKELLLARLAAFGIKCGGPLSSFGV